MGRTMTKAQLAHINTQLLAKKKLKMEKFREGFIPNLTSAEKIEQIISGEATLDVNKCKQNTSYLYLTSAYTYPVDKILDAQNLDAKLYEERLDAKIAAINEKALFAGTDDNALSLLDQ